MHKILCIEDELDLREDICEELRDHGFSVLEADNGADGLNLIRTEMPDLVLCDIRMPVMNGHELVNKVRQGFGAWAGVPFLFLSAYGEKEDVLKGLADGADDYLTKPIDYDLLIARIKASLRQSKRISEFERQSRRDLQKELNRAHNMQRDLLPSRETERVLERAYNIRLTSHYEPSNELGGDIWGVQLVSAKKMMFYVVDFSGHGVAAALNTFRLHSKIDSEPISGESPEVYLENLNRWLCSHLQTGQYATVLLGILDFELNKFTYAAAGSTAPIKLCGTNHVLEIGSGKGVPLGINPDAKYELRAMDFKPKDCLFLYSDALVEHGRRNGVALGREGVEKLVMQVADWPGDLIVDDILAPFLSIAPRPLSDDLTAVCCVWKD